MDFTIWISCHLILLRRLGVVSFRHNHHFAVAAWCRVAWMGRAEVDWSSSAAALYCLAIKSVISNISNFLAFLPIAGWRRVAAFGESRGEWWRENKTVSV
jgi:hypothetical protein